MRPLEITIAFLLAFYLLWPHPHPRGIRLLPLAAFLITLLHVVLEGYRWQMIPLYVLTCLLAAGIAFRKNSSSRGNHLFSALAVILLTAATALPLLLPVPSLPSPGGSFPVGTRSYELNDTARKELYSGRDETRRFQIQVWYPSQAGAGSERAPWMARTDVFGPAIASYIHMPSFFLDHLALVKMPAFKETDLATTEEGYPVILFSHGWNGFNAQNTGQAIELASHGYIVVGVQHPYGAVVTVFEDGTIARNNPAALPAEAPDEEYDVAAQTLAVQWAGDLGYALDFLEQQNNDPESPLYQSLDLSRVGVYGHSTGGGAAIQFCGTDARCQALLGMDPFMRPVSTQVLENGVAQPAFFMFSQTWADEVDSRNNQLFQTFLQNAPQAWGVISIRGTSHYDFSDLPLLSPLSSQLGLKGPINGQRVTVIINDYLVSFFDAALKAIRTDLFERQTQKYNEVKFSR